MPWIVLLFAAGSLAIPAPSIMLVPPHPSSKEDPIHISCMAPRGFPGANFTLYQDGEVVELLKAPKDQLRVIFNLSGGSREVRGGPFCCQYSVLGENRQPQLSNLSEPVHVSFPVPTWILALSLSLAGAALLLAGLVIIALIIRKVKVKNLNKRRERESCWVNIATTGLCLRVPVPCLGRVTASKCHRVSLLAAEPHLQLFTSLRIQNTCSSSFPSSSPLIFPPSFHLSLFFLFDANSFHLLPFPALSSSRSLIPLSA
nr:PREDICTED: protein HIDE1 isoform X1 [Bos indicus]